MDTSSIRCCDNSQSFSTLSLHSESCYDPEVELSSSEKVFSNQDLLTLILLHVPSRKLICFTSVSKLWHSLITAPRFTLLHSNGDLPLRTSGIFFQLNVCKLGMPNFISFVPLDNDNHTTSPFRKLPFVRARDPYIPRIRIVHSCAGLLLCSSCPLPVPTPSSYYIYNPTTNQLRTLPENDLCDWHYRAVLAFDPSKSPHYKVFICAKPTTLSPNLIQFYISGRPFPIQKQFYIYSSKTGTWRSSGQIFTSKSTVFNFSNIVYCNGCVHWINESIFVPEATDREDDNSCYYFNLDEERLETMPRPPIGLRSSRTVTSYMGVSENHLHVVEVFACDNLLNVYEMESNYSGWFLKYEVDLSPISQVFPEMMTTPDQVYILLLVRRENSEEDSFLVLHIPGKPRKAIRYNLVDKSFKGIWEFSYPKNLTKQLALVQNSILPWPTWYPPRKFQAFQFIESLSHV